MALMCITAKLTKVIKANKTKKRAALIMNNKHMPELMNQVNKVFERLLGQQPEVTCQAPGRVNLIGEHTDYNDGFVLPCGINYQVVACANRRVDDMVKVISLDYDNQVDEFSLNDDIIKTTHDWANYIRGVVKQLKQRGFRFSGADIVVSGNVPQGAGLSSSAALEVVIGQVFNSLYQLNISSQDIALIAQAAENQFVGCSCGIMDQLISAQATKDHALLIDCRSLTTTAISIPDGMSILIVNSNVKRGLVDSEYNTRREQCEAAAKFFKVTALRDVDYQTFTERAAELEPVIAKRARHVITENSRTLAAAKAMSSGDMQTLQQLMTESHTSMRDDFEITVPEIDTLVDIIKAEIAEQGGVRMTGGGFGGCVVALVPHKLVTVVTDAVNTKYQEKTGLIASVFVCSAEDGAGKLAHIN